MITRFYRDTAEIVLWIHERNPDAATRFSDAVNDALRRLDDHPELGARRDIDNPRLQDLRIWPIPEFPDYLILYLPSENDGIIPLRLVHGAMDYPKRLRDDFFDEERET
jgi:plasmid stabilization system protein ParE